MSGRRRGEPANDAEMARLYLRDDGDINGRDDAHAVQAGLRFAW